MPRELDEAAVEVIEKWMNPFNDGDVSGFKECVHSKCTNYPVLEEQHHLVKEGGPEGFIRVVQTLRKGFPNLCFQASTMEEVGPKDKEYLLGCFQTSPFEEVCPADISATLDKFLGESDTKVLLKAILSGTQTGPVPFLPDNLITGNFTKDPQLHLIRMKLDENDNHRLKIIAHGGCRNDPKRNAKLRKGT